MSATEVLTEAHSVGVIHARACHPTPSLKRSSFDEAGQIELADLNQASSSRVSNATSKTSPTPPSSEASPRVKWLASIQFATMCWTLFLAGWNDGTTGPMLERIQDHYHVSLLA